MTPAPSPPLALFQKFIQFGSGILPYMMIYHTYHFITVNISLGLKFKGSSIFWVFIDTWQAHSTHSGPYQALNIIIIYIIKFVLLSV